MIYHLAILLCGMLFGCGLTISNMINPDKILNFLDVSGNWDPSLLLVMLGALTVTWAGYKLVLKRPHPVWGSKFFLPRRSDIDFRLIFGAAVFGIGWGLSGYCPGPGITAVILGSMDPVYFLAGLALSILINRIVSLFDKM
jgi:uncharacterized membrane protein YedE/YeeE